MSIAGQFQIEEEDIVKLLPTNSPAAGWVNVGVFAIRILITEDGDLALNVQPRTNELKPLHSIMVSMADAVTAGGVDPDQPMS